MACRIYCGTPISEVGNYLTDTYITIYGDENNNTVTNEFIMFINIINNLFCCNVSF